MLDTLLKIGKWQSEGLSRWARFIDAPKVSTVDEKGNPINNYVVEIVFDLDAQTIYVNEASLKEYDEDKTAEQLKAIKVQGGHNKSIYATTEPKKINQIFKTFFGKLENEEADRGELVEAIEKDYPQFMESRMYKLLMEIFELRPNFIELAVKEDKEKTKLDAKYLLEPLELSRRDNVALIYVSVKSKDFSLPEPQPFAQLETYEEFLTAKFLTPSDSKPGKQEAKKLCYASGEQQEQVTELNLSKRYSLNKMFVTKTKNYARMFDKKAFTDNYQVGLKAQEYLDLASSYLLENFKVKIAGIDHVILPEFLNQESIDYDLALEKIGTSSEFLFQSTPLEKSNELVEYIELESETVFWLSFLAFDSDRKFFKTTGQIKDVSRFYFQKIIQVFHDVNWEMRSLKRIVDWEAANQNYGNVTAFNLQSVYQLIPVRKDKEKKNKVLALFKSILENRQIYSTLIFEYFCELMLCHFYARYAAYKNIYDYSSNGNRKREDYFIWACRDSVFKYLAFIQVLKRLKLIDMETTETSIDAKGFNERVDHFFNKMEVNEAQKAMFHLGRMLNAVTRLQKDKKKTALEKVNFSGMDQDDIIRLRISLVEKAKQYGEVGKVIFHDARFGECFDFQNWSMPPQQAVFFLLTGYSFGLVKSETTEPETE